MFKSYCQNRILENQFELYKNKVLYTALRNVKPKTKSTWENKCLPIINKRYILEIKDRKRIQGFINIAQENLRFFQRLSKCKSSYKLEQYKYDYDVNKYILNKNKRYNFICIPKYKDDKMKYNKSALNFYKKTYIY